MVIAVIIIFVVFHGKCSTTRGNNSRVGNTMPADESSSKRERYELKPTDSKEENIVFVGGKGIINEGIE